MTTIQIINYGAVELYADEYGINYRDVGCETWDAIPIRDADKMDECDMIEFLIAEMGCDGSWLEIGDAPSVDTYGTFIKDEAKMRDFLQISKDEFLFTYSYLDEDDYNATYDAVMSLIGKSLGWDIDIAEEFGCSVMCPLELLEIKERVSPPYSLNITTTKRKEVIIW